MTEPPRTPGQPQAAPPAPPSRRTPWHRRRPARWLLAAATFVVGLFVGGVFVGLVSGGSTPAPAPTTTITVAPSTPPSAAPSTGGSGGLTGQVTVNAACLRAINDAQSASADIGDLVSALRSLSASRIDEAIRQLEPLETRLQSELQDCQVASTLPSGIAGATGPTGAAAPTGSPTPSGG